MFPADEGADGGKEQARPVTENLTFHESAFTGKNKQVTIETR